jgi:hypothetical protein
MITGAASRESSFGGWTAICLQRQTHYGISVVNHRRTVVSDGARIIGGGSVIRCRGRPTRGAGIGKGRQGHADDINKERARAGLRRECAFQDSHFVGKVVAGKSRVPQHDDRAGDRVGAGGPRIAFGGFDKKLS